LKEKLKMKEGLFVFQSSFIRNVAAFHVTLKHGIGESCSVMRRKTAPVVPNGHSKHANPIKIDPVTERNQH